jgi:hypothetical protein
MPAKLAGALRAVTLAIALTLPGAATALADPPGYYFQDSVQPAPQLLAAPPVEKLARCAG